MCENMVTEIEDYDTIEVEKESGITDEKNVEDYPNLSIKIEQAQYSIFEIKRRYDKGKICLDPDFQRNSVWNLRQKSELIESVIMGIPLPLIYLAENADGKLIVVDGRQRLSTFFDFLNDKFRLRDLKILSQINGMNMTEMNDNVQYSRYVTMIEDTQLVVQIIKYPTKDRVRFDIFDRVNRGGTPLNKQEMRNALYQGNATRLLKELADLESFQEATGKSISQKHMKDRYIILRALSFYLLFKDRLVNKKGQKVVYRSDMEEFLGNGMQYLNLLDENETNELRMLFDDTMKMAYQCSGADGFRIPSKKKSKRPVSMTLFETLFFYYTLFGETREYATIRKGIESLLCDEEYLQSLQHSVDSSVHVKTRFIKVIEKYEEIADVIKNKDSGV